HEHILQMALMIEAFPRLTRFSTAMLGTVQVNSRERLDRLSAALNGHTNLRRLDLNGFWLGPSVRFDVSQILPRLERFTLGWKCQNPERVLAEAGPLLAHLTINEINC